MYVQKLDFKRLQQNMLTASLKSAHGNYFREAK